MARLFLCQQGDGVPFGNVMEFRYLFESSGLCLAQAQNDLYLWTISTILFLVSAFILQLPEFSLSLTLVQSSFYFLFFSECWYCWQMVMRFMVLRNFRGYVSNEFPGTVLLENLLDCVSPFLLFNLWCILSKKKVKNSFIIWVNVLTSSILTQVSCKVPLCYGSWTGLIQSLNQRE